MPYVTGGTNTPASGTAGGSNACAALCAASCTQNMAPLAAAGLTKMQLAHFAQQCQTQCTMRHPGCSGTAEPRITTKPAATLGGYYGAYVIGKQGRVKTCPYFYSVVASEAECNVAAQQLGKKFVGTLRNDLSRIMPSGCIISYGTCQFASAFS